MGPGGTTEMIWHFAGYLRIDFDSVQSRVVYDHGAHLNRPGDYKAALPDYRSPADLDPFDTQPARVDLVNFSSELAHSSAQLRLPPNIFPKIIKGPISNPHDQPLTGQGVAGAYVGPHLNVVYEPGGNQIQLEVKQTNFASDDDRLVVAQNTGIDDLQHVDVKAELSDMLRQSFASIPVDLQVPQPHGDALASFFKLRDANAPTDESASSDDSVKPGVYQNGVLRPDDAANPESIHKDPLADLGKEHGQWAELGSNVSQNYAYITDLTESGRSMVVGGDYHKINAIIQTNAYSDKDQVDVSGDNAVSKISNGGNRADNIADFEQHPGVYSTLKAYFAGPNWHVDTVDGDFFDVRSAVQKNFISDNDVVAQESWNNHYEIHAGANQQYNIFDMSGGEFKYDLIIIKGSYYGANVIYQHNVLLDDDIVKTATADGSTTSQTVVAGQNELVNKAAISTYGDDTFLPMSKAMQDAMSALSSGDATMDWNIGKAFDNTGGAYKVLYVSGDYYDINALWQINVVADVDTLIQLQHTGDDGGLGPQTAVTGNNQLTNAAAIVDVGGTKTFVNGHSYSDSILVQANLVSDDKDDVHYGDTHTLIPEVIAFIGSDDSDSHGHTTPFINANNVHDMIGSILH